MFSAAAAQEPDSAGAGSAMTSSQLVAAAETASQDAPLTLEGKVLGTVGYTAPEQVRGHPADHRSDIFSFGCVLYECLTYEVYHRRSTHPASLRAALEEPPPEVTSKRPDGFLYP